MHRGIFEYAARFALIGSQDLNVKNRPNIFTPLTHRRPIGQRHTRLPLLAGLQPMGNEMSGEIDQETAHTMSLPRCGVKDKVGYGSDSRTKRYALQGTMSPANVDGRLHITVLGSGDIPDIRKWESCRTMPLVGGFSRGFSVSPAASYSTRSTLIGSQDLVVKSHTNLSKPTVQMFDSRCVKKPPAGPPYCSTSGGERKLNYVRSGVSPPTPCRCAGRGLHSPANHDYSQLAVSSLLLTTLLKAQGKGGGGHGSQAVSPLASHQGEPLSIPGRVTPDFRTWESCRTMPLVGGFSRGSPVFPALSFRRCSILTSVTLIGSQDHDVKSRKISSLHCMRVYKTVKSSLQANELANFSEDQKALVEWRESIAAARRGVELSSSVVTAAEYGWARASPHVHITCRENVESRSAVCSSAAVESDVISLSETNRDVSMGGVWTSDTRRNRITVVTVASRAHMRVQPAAFVYRGTSLMRSQGHPSNIATITLTLQ
ncbi:hypothetical protein PR048_027400 [Dryococelus australis]|uniref:Uncharacterized protein n=1 Tax=Dryococelus australis TaxID=614101 RepID=A0ABQ9GGN7_9NEOP|nr:hypothetical protein PR048_027400 [Dryococelus australis]